MTINKSVCTTVRMTPVDSQIFNQAAKQMGISKAELFLRSTRFVLSNKTDDNEFLAPESLLKNILERFTQRVEQRAIETGVLKTDGTLAEPEVDIKGAVKRWVSDRAGTLTDA